MDLDGIWWVFEQRPVKLETVWVRLPSKSKALNVSQIVNIEPAVEWETSLIEVKHNA